MFLRIFKNSSLNLALWNSHDVLVFFIFLQIVRNFLIVNCPKTKMIAFLLIQKRQIKREMKQMNQNVTFYVSLSASLANVPEDLFWPH